VSSSFWNRDSTNGILTPSNGGDSLSLGLDVNLDSNGVARFGRNTGSSTQPENGILCDGQRGFLSIFKNQATGTQTNYITCGKEYADINFKLDADGVIYAENTVVQPVGSERRLKENITPIDPVKAWETIKSTPYYSYNFKTNTPDVVTYGPMADEVPSDLVVLTERRDRQGPIRSYDNGLLMARLYVALQMALSRIEALEAPQ